MKKGISNNKKISFKDKIFRIQFLLTIFAMLFLSVGFAQLSTDLEVNGNIYLKPQDNIAIINVTNSSSSSNSYANIKEYTRTNLTSLVHLDNNTNDPYVSIDVTIKNLGNTKQIYDGLLYSPSAQEFYSNDNIIPYVSGVTSDSTIVDTVNSSNSTITLNIRFKYDDVNNITDNNLNSIINIHFTPLRDITYANMNDSSLPVYVRSKSFTNVNGNTINGEINFTNNIPSSVNIKLVDGTVLQNGIDYTYTNGVITFINELTNNIIVETENTYNISYVLNGGTNPDDQITSFVTTDEMKYLLSPTQKGYVFMGWYDNANFNGSEITTTSEIKSDITLYAKWREEVKTTIASNGETFASKIKTIANNGTTVGGYSVDNNIYQILKATKEQYEDKKDSLTSENIIGTNLGDAELVVWFENGTIYFYTEADKIALKGNAARTFCKMPNLTDISGLEYFDLSEATDTNRMFQDSTGITDLSPIADWDVSNVTDMTFMFGSNKTQTGGSFMSINDLSPLANWNVSNVTTMNQMFKGIGYVRTLVPLKNWNVSNLTNLNQTFNYLGNQSGLDDDAYDGIKDWDVRKVTNFTNTLNNTPSSPTKPPFTLRTGRWSGAGTYTPR